jgi:hypothetical protein
MYDNSRLAPNIITYRNRNQFLHRHKNEKNEIINTINIDLNLNLNLNIPPPALAPNPDNNPALAIKAMSSHIKLHSLPRG